jgi:outer membrane immunogenic protein
MKKVILAGTAFVALTAAIPALATDVAPPMPVKALIAPAWSWTGFYIGANVGGGWGSRSADYSANDQAAAALFADGGTPPSTSFKSSGALGGLQLGYNWQFDRNWLVGVEADFDGSGMKGSGSGAGIITVGPTPFTATVDERIEWFGTVRARLGYLPADNLLTYVTGGFAYGRVEHSGRYSAPSGVGFGAGGYSVNCVVGAASCFAGSSSSVASGWTAGAGLEYAIWKNVTFKAEYLYVSLGSKSVTETALAVDNLFGGTPASFNANSRTSFNVARVGLNYHF